VGDGVYNIASGVETSLLGLAQAMLRATGSDLDVEFGPPRQVNGVTRRLADVSAARHDLGFVAEVELEDGLRELVDWWRLEQAELAGGRSA
jgi:UDP-glucose 4-epimerase